VHPDISISSGWHSTLAIPLSSQCFQDSDAIPWHKEQQLSKFWIESLVD
jgi:hypothetical protein